MPPRISAPPAAASTVPSILPRATPYKSRAPPAARESNAAGLIGFLCSLSVHEDMDISVSSVHHVQRYRQVSTYLLRQVQCRSARPLAFDLPRGFLSPMTMS